MKKRRRKPLFLFFIPLQSTYQSILQNIPSQPSREAERQVKAEQVATGDDTTSTAEEDVLVEKYSVTD